MPSTSTLPPPGSDAGDEPRNTVADVTRMVAEETATGNRDRLRHQLSDENLQSAMAATERFAKHGRHSVESMDSTHLSNLEKLARDGSKGAQYRLACNYSETPDMESEAYEWMTKAASQGNPAAISKLALFHYHGYGTDQDSSRAFELATLASEASVAESLGLLGMMYMLGDESVDQDHTAAYRYSSRGALLGDGLAQRTLAKLYSEGLGCDKDSKQAVYWIRKAASRHNVFQHHAQYELGMWYWEGTHMDADHTLGMSWLLRAAKGRLPDALLMLGHIFEEGMGSYSKNPQRAAFFYEECVLEEEVEGMYRLGKLHCIQDRNESAGERWADFTYGIEMLTQAVHRGHSSAFNLLEETLQLVAGRYPNMNEFRSRIADGVRREDTLCLAIQAALDAIAMYQTEENVERGLSEKQIADIPSKTLESSMEDSRCCICLMDFEKDDECKELRCKHMFHCDCIDQWLGQNRKCPLCKQPAVEL